jgi:hypothetical protein
MWVSQDLPATGVWVSQDFHPKISTKIYHQDLPRFMLVLISRKSAMGPQTGDAPGFELDAESGADSEQ